jgi:hypothetical protein
MHTLLKYYEFQATQSFLFQISFQTYFIDILRYLPWILMAVFGFMLVKEWKWLAGLNGASRYRYYDSAA